MRSFLAALALTLVLAGCDVFGGVDRLRLTYSVNATGANGPVTLTYDTPNGPVRVENAAVPFQQQVEFNNPRLGAVFLLNAETTCTGPCTLSTEVSGALGSTPFSSEDIVTYPADTMRTIASQASILYR